MMNKLFISFLFLFSFSQYTLAENYNNGIRTALVIGNSSYNSAPLANPKNDAEDIGRTLKKLGFDVIQVLDGSLKNMNEAVTKFGRKLEINGGVGLFFYAGHGVQSAGRNYLIPINSNINRETDLKYNALDAGRVMDEMGYANNGLNIAILDACRNNPLTRSFRSGKKGLARIDDAPTGLLIAYSTAPGKQAADGHGRNSPYTKSLITAMQEKNLPLETVFKQVVKSVKKETRGKQIPWVSSSVDGDFYFNGQKKTKKVAPLNLPANQSLANNNKNNQKFEILYWETVSSNPTPAKYRAYLQKYPNGHFAELAKSELKNALASNSRKNIANQSTSKTINRGISIKLKKCQQHLKQKALTSGKNGNAFDCYQSVLSKQPNNVTAQQGLLTIENNYAELIEQALKDNKKRKAKLYIQRLEKINVFHPQLVQFKQQLNPKKNVVKTEKIVKPIAKKQLTTNDKVENSNKLDTNNTSSTFTAYFADEDSSSDEFFNSEEDKQIFEEFSEVLEELIADKNYKKAKFYLAKLQKLAPNNHKLSVFKNQIYGTPKTKKLSKEDKEVFEEYIEILAEILDDAPNLSVNQRKKSAKYITELDKLNPQDKQLIKLKEIFSSSQK